MERYGYIYKTTNIENKKIYIGMHKSKKFNETYYGSGILIKKALKKYGIDNFIVEIIEWVATRDELCKKEKYWIDFFNSRNPNIGYNLAYGGECGDIFHTKSTEDQDKIKKAISEKNKGTKQTLEWIEKRKLSGKKNPMYGKHCSEETKQKIRQSKLGDKNPNYGKIYTEQELLHLSELFLGDKNPRAISCHLFCIETQNTTQFGYIKQALDSVLISQSQYYYRKNKDGIMISPKDNMHYKIILSNGGDNNE